MCGFVGGFGFSVAADEVKNSMHFLEHRGPDYQGFNMISETCCMGVARLAMTDPLPRSNQPFFDENYEYALSFNGEIYNYMNLRSMLTKLGYSFRTESDTEVVLNLLRAKGVQALSLLEGMFAFAYYDSNTKYFLAARDSLGKKPFYFAVKNKNLYWSSSLKVVNGLINGGNIGNRAIAEYFSLGYILDPKTILDEVHSLKPGHYIESTLEKISLEQVKFRSNGANTAVSSDLQSSLLDAVRVRIKGHAQTALSLSGGIDSSIIALCLSDLGIKTQAYSAYWSDSDKERYNSDKEHAKLIANILGHEFHEVDISSNLKLEDSIRKFLVAMEEPNNNPSGLSSYFLYEAVSKNNNKLLLTGDGSDEIFGGYERYSKVVKIPYLRQDIFNLSKLTFIGKSKGLTRKLANFFASQIQVDDPIAWLHWHWVFTPKEISLLNNQLGTKYEILNNISNTIFDLDSNDNVYNRAQGLMKRDQSIWLSMESNRKLDRLTMAHSIEARCPFQDENVINAANKVMKETRYRNLNKLELIRQFPKLTELPIKEKKEGFISPVGHWMRTNEKFVSESIQYLQNEPGWNKHILNRFVGAQFLGDFKVNMQLWTLVIYANWLRILRNV